MEQKELMLTRTVLLFFALLLVGCEGARTHPDESGARQTQGPSPDLTRFEPIGAIQEEEAFRDYEVKVYRSP